MSALRIGIVPPNPRSATVCTGEPRIASPTDRMSRSSGLLTRTLHSRPDELNDFSVGINPLRRWPGREFQHSNINVLARLYDRIDASRCSSSDSLIANERRGAGARCHDCSGAACVRGADYLEVRTTGGLRIFRGFQQHVILDSCVVCIGVAARLDTPGIGGHLLRCDTARKAHFLVFGCAAT